MLMYACAFGTNAAIKCLAVDFKLGLPALLFLSADDTRYL